MKELRTDQFVEKHKTIPKIGYTLFDYVQINDSTFDYLCQMRFGDKSLYEYKGICAQCGRPQSDHHILVCPYTNNVRTIKHDKVVEGFMKLMDEKKQCKVVCKENMNMCGERAKPDLEFKFNNKRYLIDVSFVHDKNTMKQRFEGKIQKYINCHKIYGDHQVIPIIIGYDGILYEKTLTLLKGEEFKQEFEEEDRFAALYKIIYREIAKAWHHAENLTYQKTIDDIRKGMYPTNGEEDDDTLGQRSGLLDHGVGTLT